MKFLRFSEPYLSNNKADSFHANSLSFRNCMLRVPGSYNSKCVQKNNNVADSTTEVKIIKRWNGYRPAINWLPRDFRRYLIEEKIDNAIKDTKLKGKRRCNYYATNHTNNHPNKLPWIEALLETPIVDFRKFSIWRILVPYLINVRGLPSEECFRIIKDWLTRCNELERLNFNVNAKIKEAINRVGKYRPISPDNLKLENRDLYDMIKIPLMSVYAKKFPNILLAPNVRSR